MNKIFKFSYLLMAFASIGFVACKDAEPEVDKSLLEAEVAARETLTSADAYVHGDVYGLGSYKFTATFMSEGVAVAYDEDGSYAGFSGSGYAFEIELNNEVEEALVAGTYTDDQLDVNDEYEHAVFTVNPEHTNLKIVHNGNAVTQALSDIKVVVSGAAPNYKVAITAKNAMGMEVKGNFSGKIEPLDIYYWREPLTEQKIAFTPTSIAQTASSNNAYYCKKYAIELFSVTMESAEGHLLVLSFQAPTGGKTSEFYLENLPTGTYKTSNGSLAAGYWDVYDSEGAAYDPEISDYRSEPSFAGSYLVSAAGDVYYLSDAVVDVVAEGAVIKELTLDASSAYGTPVTVEYSAE